MIIIINGSRNSGKTTTSKLLAEKLGNTANIEIDTFQYFLTPFLNLEDTLSINLENAVLVTQNLVRKGFNVILNYCLRSQDYDYLIKSLQDTGTKIYAFTLKPDLNVALSNRTGTRELSENDIKRIQDQYNPDSIHALAEAGIEINTKNKSSEQVVGLILERLS